MPSIVFRQHSRSFFIAFAALALLGLFALPACAQTVHRWVDSQGHVHYGDAAAAPAGSSVTEIRAPAPATSTTPGKPEDSSSSASNVAADKPSTWPKDAEGRPIAPTAQAACELAKKNRDALNNTKRPAVTYDEHGAAHLLTSKERQKRLAEANERIKQLCPGQ